MSLIKATYDAQGYVLVPSLVPPPLLPDLRAAADRITAHARTGTWPHRRTVGKQFPPFDDGPDAWGIQHIMHPALAEPIFAQWYTSAPVRAAAATLLACAPDALQMELFNLLIDPLGGFALRWHRDDVREDASADEERHALAVSTYGVQWNTALYEDSCLYVVPGSHRASRTEAQRAHSSALDAPRDPLAMPGAVCLTLQRKSFHSGDTVFYNANILHCARYDAGKRRATLHASMGDTRGGSARARNVLQHGLQWMREQQFRDTLDEAGQHMLDALIRMQDSVQGDLGYSLTG